MGGLHVEITMAGYLITSVVLLLMWLGTIFLYDPMRYLVFTPGQFVVHKEIGDLREVYDLRPKIEAEKSRTNLFRYWILGFGAWEYDHRRPQPVSANRVSQRPVCGSGR